MESTVTVSNESLKVLEKKCEERIERAMDVGAGVSFDAARKLMDIGRRYGTDVGHRRALAYLETGIAEANRKRMNQASRRPITFVFAPFISLINWIRQG